MSLWVINWYAGRALFLDEANVARNLYDRSFLELFLPLDHDQYAPPLYLVFTKLCGNVFGYGELALRLPSLFGGGLAVVSLLFAGKKLGLGGWTSLAIALLFVNPLVLRYVGEVKPYALDLGVAALVITLFLYYSKPAWWWGLFGVVAVWVSLPVVFSLAAIALYAAWNGSWKDLRRWALLSFTWLCSFFLLYYFVLRPSIGSSYLNHFHDQYFFPLPLRYAADFKQALNLLVNQPRLAFGFTTFAMIWGAAVTAYALVKKPTKKAALLLLPLLLVFLVSTTKHYSLIPRLMLFTLPGWWVLAALGTAAIYRSTGKRVYVKLGLVIFWCLVLGGTNVFRHFAEPLRTSDARRLSTGVEEGYTVLLHRSAVPTYDYYQRIHPGTSRTEAPLILEQDLKDQPSPGSYVVLYDVLTRASTRQRIQQDSTWAVANGASEVRAVPMFRAQALYVTIP